METLEQLLTHWIGDRFRQAFPEAELDDSALEVVPTTDESFGDYQCNAAMGLARVLKRAPRAIAEAAVEGAELPEAIERIEIAGPGFVNLHLRAGWLPERLAAMKEDPHHGFPQIGDGKSVVVDYSSPNVAKQMHIGHIRSTVIGNAIDRLHRALGYRVIADNHLGDWGTQFGILIHGYNQLHNDDALMMAPLETLEKLYTDSYEKSRGDEAWLAACRGELVKLQQGDEENRRKWKQFVELSLSEFNEIYDRLDVAFDVCRGESYYNDQLPALVEEMKASGLAQQSEGAQVVFLEEEKLPVCLVQKSDGAFNYATTDLATIRDRVREFSPDKIVYVTDERQQTHFRQVFTVARKLGVTTRLDHVWFGLMRLPEGTFSTREGNVIKLQLLLDEAETRALVLVQASSPEMPETQQREVARAVGIGAVKYADLSQNPQSLVTFSWDKALALDGNSAPYLQYAHARICSVLDKYRERFPDTDPESFPMVLEDPTERRLALCLARFPETVLHAGTRYRPNALADYLYDLAQLYSRFYQNVPFLKAEEGTRESRIRLCGLAAATLKRGLGLLGIEAPERI